MCIVVCIICFLWQTFWNWREEKGFLLCNVLNQCSPCIPSAEGLSSISLGRMKRSSLVDIQSLFRLDSSHGKLMIERVWEEGGKRCIIAKCPFKRCSCTPLRIWIGNMVSYLHFPCHRQCWKKKNTTRTDSSNALKTVIACLLILQSGKNIF